MKRLFKIVAIALVVLIALIGAAVLLVPVFFDPNDYKAQIEAQIEKRLGRDVAIEGNLDVSVFPWLGVEVGPVRVANAPGFGDEPLARAAGAEARVKLLPLLLRRELEMDTLRLDGLALNLARNAKGEANWQGLLKGSEAEAVRRPAASSTEAPPAEGGRDGQAVGVLALGGIQITDAQVDWDDRAAGSHYMLSQVDLRSGEIVPGQPFDVSAEFDFQVPAQKLSGHAAFSGEVRANPDAAQYQLNDAEMTVTAKGEGLPPEGVEARLATALSVDLKQQTLAAPQLALTVAGVEVRGSVQGKNILDAPAVQGSFQVAEFSPREVLQRLGQEAPVTADPQALSRARASLELAASPKRVKLDKITAQLDASNLTGEATVQNFADPRIAFDLALDGIDLDRYLPPPSKEQEQKTVATPTGAAAAAAGALPVETLRGLNLNGALRVGQLTVAGVRAGNLRLTVAAKDGVLRMQPATADLYQGKYEGNMSLDVRGQAPQLTLNDKLAGVQAGPLLKDLFGKERLTGTADVTAQLGMTGLTAEAIRGSLNGNASFAFRDGAVKGFNIAGMIRRAQATIQGQQLAQEQAEEQTDFSEVTGTLNIADGVVHNRDLSGKSPLLRVTGEGSLNLKSEEIDYLLKAVLVKTLQGQGGKGLEELQGVTIPIRVAGTISDPAFRPDLEAAVGERVRGEAQKRVEEQREKVEKRLEEQLQERLKGILQ